MIASIILISYNIITLVLGMSGMGYSAYLCTGGSTPTPFAKALICASILLCLIAGVYFIAPRVIYQYRHEVNAKAGGKVVEVWDVGWKMVWLTSNIVLFAMILITTIFATITKQPRLFELIIQGDYGHGMWRRNQGIYFVHHHGGCCAGLWIWSFMIGIGIGAFCYIWIKELMVGRDTGKAVVVDGSDDPHGLDLMKKDQDHHHHHDQQDELESHNHRRHHASQAL